ncbi:hypothetical protein OHB49_03865 [Streptomyces sp. NBC_01717]|uniref:hypothetical protein n=1 Tax=Streptomyces sp. NBC_01717 TaxID=2975918 RepID=UPI002E324141|nr:hypothetical protein [Streptomyces sp. NBC_01717]
MTQTPARSSAPPPPPAVDARRGLLGRQLDRYLGQQRSQDVHDAVVAADRKPVWRRGGRPRRPRRRTRSE